MHWITHLNNLQESHRKWKWTKFISFSVLDICNILFSKFRVYDTILLAVEVTNIYIVFYFYFQIIFVWFLHLVAKLVKLVK